MVRSGWVLLLLLITVQCPIVLLCSSALWPCLASSRIFALPRRVQTNRNDQPGAVTPTCFLRWLEAQIEMSLTGLACN